MEEFDIKNVDDKTIKWILEIPTMLKVLLYPFDPDFKIRYVQDIDEYLEKLDAPDDIKEFVRKMYKTYFGFIYSILGKGDKEDEGVEKIALMQPEPVPPQYRYYIKETDIKRMPPGVRIYRGKRGALYVDLRELRRVRQKVRVKMEDKIQMDEGGELKNWDKIVTRPNELTEEELERLKYLGSIRRMINYIKSLIDMIKDFEVIISDDKEEDEGKWKAAYVNGKIKIFARNIPKEERLKVSEVGYLLRIGELDKAMNTLGWYYYHMVGHLMVREYGMTKEHFDMLRKWYEEFDLNEYSKIDIEEFWCEVFALYVLTGGFPAKYDYMPVELQETIRKILSELFRKGYSNKDRYGGYVYDSFDPDIGVKKSEIKELEIEEIKPKENKEEKEEVENEEKDVGKALEILKSLRSMVEEELITLDNNVKKALYDLVEYPKLVWFTQLFDEEDEEIIKANMSKAFEAYMKEVANAGEFWWKYSGLTEEQSKKINEFLREVIQKGLYWNEQYVINGIMKFGVPYNRAKTIARTELAHVANLAREVAYRTQTNVEKFVYWTEPDACEVCKRIAQKTRYGVRLDELKWIIKMEAGGTARGFLSHPNCRCIPVRKNKVKRSMRDWESFKITRILR